MKKITFFSVLLIMLSGCSHKIIRTGYQINKSDYRNCDIDIKKSMQITDSLQKIGGIKLGDSGFSVSCSEANAIEILKNEACALNADVINITEEKRPDLLSSCYRCSAEFYKYKNPKMRDQNNEFYKSENINKRVAQDRSRNSVIGIVAIIIGFTFGYLMVQ